MVGRSRVAAHADVPIAGTAGEHCAGCSIWFNVGTSVTTSAGMSVRQRRATSMWNERFCQITSVSQIACGTSTAAVVAVVGWPAGQMIIAGRTRSSCGLFGVATSPAG